ncbi:MAG: hypothetical protein DRH08_04565 [Deltaproteobacteria bacterium]|nr:MAG: hypothetical protein DRH08_04565 [Deltaproteobacteria bacterium]
MNDIFSKLDMCQHKNIAEVSMFDEMANKQNDTTGYCFSHGLGFHQVKGGERAIGTRIMMELWRRRG